MYKITNSNENHNGFQFKDGLNELDQKFNDNSDDSCCGGGFYITDIDHIIKFLDFGCFMREVTLPKDTNMVMDPDGDKWRIDKMILEKGMNYLMSKHLNY